MRQRDLEPVVALLYTALLLTLMEYLIIKGGYGRDIVGRSIWALATIVGFGLLPPIIARFFGRTPASIGLSFTGFTKHIWIYLGMFAFMLPVIYWASTLPGFKQTYPLLKSISHAYDGRFFYWETIYILQFFAIESFYRGYLIFTLEKYMPRMLSICIMVIPYTMMHFHKPMLETLGAIFAGLILGYCSLRFRSWIGGAILHSLVAVSMDLFAISKL